MAVAEAPALFNWNLTETFRPGRVVRAESAADVQQVVKDNGQFPSPVSLESNSFAFGELLGLLGIFSMLRLVVVALGRVSPGTASHSRSMLPSCCVPGLRGLGLQL